MQPTRRSTVPSLSAGILTNDITGSGLEKGGTIGLGNTAVTSTLTAEAATTSVRRLPNTTASLPIVYGSIAFFLGRKADEFQTHKWTLFLRGPNKHDDHLSSLVISKVVFQLHPSFAKATRELTEPPYEVTERGWGEFEAQIHIHWKDPTEQTTILNHTIKLYPQGTPPTISSSATATANNNTLMQQSTEKPVLAETYDEAVFTDPTESFFQSLTQITAITKSKEEEAANVGNGNSNDNGNDNSKSNKEVDKTSSRNISSTLKDQQQPSSSLSSASSWRKHLNIVYSDQEDFLALIGAQKFLQDELSKVKRRFQIVNDEITVVDQKLVLVQQQKQREAAVVAVNGASHTGPVSSSGERKRTKKSRSTSQSKKAKNTSNNKGINVNATASVLGVTTSAKSTTAAAANRRKPITTTITTTKTIATTAVLASASVSVIPLPAPIAASKIASSSIAADSATTAITTTTSNSNSNTKAINKGEISKKQRC